MLWCFFDTETTGDDPKKHDILELAYAFYDTDERRIVSANSVLFRPLVQLPLEDEVPFEWLHKISHRVAETYGRSPAEWCRDNENLFRGCDFAVAHNGHAFDRPMVEGWSARAGTRIEIPSLIDTRTDFNPEVYGHLKCRAQAHMLAERGIANPFPHNAMADVLGLVRLSQFCDYELTAKIAQSPKIKIIADLPGGWKDNEVLKAQGKGPGQVGFTYNGEKKIWTRETRELFLEEDLAKIGGAFKYVVRRMEANNAVSTNPESGTRAHASPAHVAKAGAGTHGANAPEGAGQAPEQAANPEGCTCETGETPRGQ